MVLRRGHHTAGSDGVNRAPEPLFRGRRDSHRITLETRLDRMPPDQSEFGVAQPAPGLAFGVDPFRRERYSLRQARVHAIACDLQAIAARAETEGKRLSVLEIGVEYGGLKQHLDVWPAARNIDLYGTDIRLDDRLAGWSGLWTGDLADGYPDIPSHVFDVVICEQVLEHLDPLEIPLRTLARVLRPGGLLFVGVPTFPHGLHRLRKPLIAIADRVRPKQRGHVQTFSHRTFRRLIHERTGLDILSSRGFRIVSGGILRPLENYESWWRFNRWLGRKLPGLCIEVQVIARKPIDAEGELSVASSWSPRP
jgi:SAM-dependent methyltransferase